MVRTEKQLCVTSRRSTGVLPSATRHSRRPGAAPGTTPRWRLCGTCRGVVVMMAVESGSEVHTAPVTFPWNVEQFDKTSICLLDVQGNRLKVYGTALLNNGVHDVKGKVIEIGTTVNLVLSKVELGRHGFWDPCPCLTHEAGCQVPLTRNSNTFNLSARLGFFGEVPWNMVATTSTGSATPSPSGREWGSPGASGALLPPLAEALPVPMDVVPEDVSLRPVLSAWSPVAALRERLKVLAGPVYSTKDELWKQLSEYEARAEQQLRERQLIQGARPHETEIWDAPSKPKDPMENERHEVTHINAVVPRVPLGQGSRSVSFSQVQQCEKQPIQVDLRPGRSENSGEEMQKLTPLKAGWRREEGVGVYH